MKKNIIHSPKTVSTDKAVQTIKDAAESKEDQSLYFEIKDADLITREFQCHEYCYMEYTREKIFEASRKRTIAISGRLRSSEEMYRRENSFPKPGNINAHLTCASTVQKLLDSQRFTNT